MRLNENTIICGDKVILVPYRAEHVPTYHEWMKSPELLELTASEPLTFEQEEEMQRKWHLDEDKLTFILLARPFALSAQEFPLLSREQVRQCRMIGDVNMFLPSGIEEDGECEIMIALPEDRRHGYALEALQLFLAYAVNGPLGIPPTHLIARIGAANTPSIKLFTKLGFGVVKVVEVWNEVEMRWGYNADGAQGETVAWEMSIPDGRIGSYDIPS